MAAVGEQNRTVRVSLAPEEGTAAGGGLAPGRRRRPPSPSEQARRREWGRKWGAINARIGRQIREGDR